MFRSKVLQKKMNTNDEVIVIKKVLKPPSASFQPIQTWACAGHLNLISCCKESKVQPQKYANEEHSFALPQWPDVRIIKSQKIHQIDRATAKKGAKGQKRSLEKKLFGLSIVFVEIVIKIKIQSHKFLTNECTASTKLCKVTTTIKLSKILLIKRITVSQSYKID
jgi:hypothetical protein